MKTVHVTASIVLVFALAGCGGGGGDASATPSPQASPQGLWSGSTSSGRTMTGLVFSDGSFYVLYSAVGNASLIGGVVQGNGAASGTNFTSSNARDFNVEGLGVIPAIVSAAFTPRQSFNGSVTYS